MSESMIGSHHFVHNEGPPGELPMRFDVRWGTNDITKGPKMNLKGTISIGGLCKETPCRGSLELNYLSENKLKYTIHFEPFNTPGSLNYGKYFYVGEKVNIKPWNLPVSHTTCYGTLIDPRKKIISRSVTHFKLNTIPAFLKSLRFSFGRYQ